jgi:putative ABC transport system permease protein
MTAWRARLSVVLDTALRMALHDRMKLAGALLGVVFATFLGAQQLGIFLGLVKKNTLLTDGVVTDVWIAPHDTRQATASVDIPERALYVARTTPGVEWADPLLLASASLVTEGGTANAVQLLGFEAARGHGGPWNVTAGDPAALLVSDTVFLDTIDRAKNGGFNLGSVREINGQQVQVVGLTSGLQPFGPTYAFADYDTALRLLLRPDRDPNFVLVGVAPGADPDEVVERLQAQLPELDVMTAATYHDRVVRYVLFETQIGVSFGTSTVFGLIVGFVIVGLTMFSGVVDNLREFGMLKAIGATNLDLALILFTQALLYGVAGSGLGLLLVGLLARGIRSPELALILPPWLVFGTPLVMLAVSLSSSVLALLRLRGLEPAMVFR